MSLRRSVVSGSTWTVIGFGSSQLLRLGGNIALAALLYQEAFALMAIGSAIVQGLAMFSDLGVGQSVVQNRRGDDRDFLNTAWTIQALRGMLLALIATALAWPMAAFYAENDPAAWELRLLLPLIAISTLVQGFQSSRMMTAARHINLARITLVELSAQATAMAVMITCAWLTKSVYALALGTVVGSSVHCALSYLLIKGPPNRFRWDPAAVKEIVGFGKWIFLSTLIFFFALQLDKLVFAKLFPLDQVGVYSIAASLAIMTPTLLGRLQSMIAFPLYSRILERGEALAPVVNKCKRLMLAAGGFLVALSIAGAQTFIDFAYDDRYSAAGGYITILAVGAWFSILEVIYGAAFLATGKANLVALVNGTKVIAFCLLVGPAGYFGGLTGAIVAVAFADAVKAVVAWTVGRKMGLKDQKSDLLFTAYTLAVGGAVYFLAQRSSMLQALPDLVMLLIEFVLVSAAFAPLVWRTYRALSEQNPKPIKDEAPGTVGAESST